MTYTITEAIAEAEEDIDLLTEEMARLREDVENARAEGRQAGIDEAVEILERFIEEIPEAYGWGEEDKEADRGYQICSKNVKAMGRKALKALQEYKVRV